MKKQIIWGLCLLFLLVGAVYAQDQMIIFFKDGKTQAIELDRIQKIEYQAAPSFPVRANLPLIQDLPDRAFTASSYWANDLAGHGPPNARMGSTATWSNWSAGANNPTQWIQVDLGARSLLSAIGTKGRSGNADQWVTSYRLSTSVDGVNWNMYQQNGVDVTFRGNSDREAEVRHTLPSEVSARYLRFHPATWFGHITMRVEAYGTPEHRPGPAALPGIPVTLYWHMADNADVYLNGAPLRRYEPSFRTRPDEAPQPAFSASAVLKNGDVFTVGGRRGGSFGFMLIAVDAAGRVVFKTDQQSWKVYMPGERGDWFQPSVANASAMAPVTVQSNPWPPQRELNSRYANIASSIWGAPSERFSYLMATVQLAGHPAAQAKTYTWTFQRIGDCPGNDVASTSGSAIPASQHCNEKTLGLTAVCWDRGVQSVCTYKSVTAEQCTGGRSPGNLYKCTESADSSTVPATPVGVFRGVNLALGKAAVQSSTGFGGDAKRAVDGNTDGNYNRNSVSHTAQENQAWWQVDLGNSYRIKNIRVWNRTDCCGERLSNFYLLLSETTFGTTDLNTTIQQPAVWKYHQAGNAGTPSDIPVNHSGRYVRIQLSGANVLSLAEVEVIGD